MELTQTEQEKKKEIVKINEHFSEFKKKTTSNEKSSNSWMIDLDFTYRIMNLQCPLDSLEVKKMPSKYRDEKISADWKKQLSRMWEIKKQTFELQHRQLKAKIMKGKKSNLSYELELSHSILLHINSKLIVYYP